MLLRTVIVGSFVIIIYSPVVGSFCLRGRSSRQRVLSQLCSTTEQLQEAIWQWEQKQHDDGPHPRLGYGAVQEGLSILDTLDLDDDGTQEGLMALLEGMRSYPGGSVEFHSYAEQVIDRGLVHSNVGGDIRLPRKVRDVLERAIVKLRSRPTNHVNVAELARELDLPIHRLRDYLKLIPSALSMETTVEIVNPAIDESPTFRDQEEFERAQGHYLDTGDGQHNEELVDSYLDETIELEGSDEAWIKQEQIAGPLSDVIPDDERSTSDLLYGDTSEDDLVLEALIRTNLSRFLSSTLESKQEKVIRLYFGLDGQESGISVEGIGKKLQLAPERVSELLETAVSQLRSVYQEKYLQHEEQFGEEEST